MRPHSNHSPRTGRLRRWLVGLGLLVLLATVYGLSLNWFAQRLGDDVEKSLRVPGATDGEVMSPR
ncbi:hypothetical protein M2650_08920 [Luteimonas sp. SX5]|uniref:Two-component sensor histidine kinase n=1 Tax=Luteimonas galliterrae TaxID=2940486 RepID=A0ABT0MKG6_9GAMM|nr:hypothetical protein [Luteimonas galliterrae]MCL1634750.1 hypothetical protein [Luteimonas galliterrae]